MKQTVVACILWSVTFSQLFIGTRVHGQLSNDVNVVEAAVDAVLAERAIVGQSTNSTGETGRKGSAVWGT